MAELQTQISLEDISDKYGITADALTRLVQDGIIRANHSEENHIVSVSTVAAAANAIAEEIKPEQYAHLRGKKIRLMEASRKYSIANQSLFRWAERDYIQVTDRDFQRLELDESSVAYVVDVYSRACELTDSPTKAGWVLKRVLGS